MTGHPVGHGRARRPPSAEPEGGSGRVFAALGSCAAVTALIVLAKTVWLAESYGVGRFREFGAFWIVRNLLEAFGLATTEGVIRWSWMHEPWALNTPAETCVFAAAAFLVIAALSWMVALAAMPVLLRMQVNTIRLTVIVSLLLPEILIPIRLRVVGEISKQHMSLTALLTTALAGAVLWFALSSLGRRSPLVHRSLRGVLLLGTALAFLLPLVGAIAVAGTLDDAPPPAPSGSHPNVLLISLDSLRADHLSSYGYERETSPFIDELASEGVRFETVVAPSSWTLPSHVTMLSALPPVAHRVMHSGVRMNPNVWTLQEALLAGGYETKALVSAGFLGAHFGYLSGFERYDDYSVPYLSDPGAPRWVSAPILVPAAQAYLERWDAGGRERPFFLFLHLWDVHFDYIPPSPFDTMFDPDYAGGMLEHDSRVEPPMVHAEMDPRDLEHLVALYDGEIRFTDLWVGRLLDTLDEIGAREDTIVVLTADHGEEFFEHGNWAHNKTLYGESILVPLILRYPGVLPAGATVSEPVRLMDLAPTLASLAGVEPGELGGGRSLPETARDLTALAKGGASRAAPASTGAAAYSDLFDKLASAQDGRFKLVRYLDGSSPDELYDLAKDPSEKSNIAGSRPEVAARLAQKLEQWRRQWPKLGGGARSVRLTPEQEDRLRALGYIQ